MDEETLNVLTGTQESVVEAQPQESEIDYGEDDFDSMSKSEEEVAAPQQSHEDNQAAKAARLQAENQASAKIAQMQEEQDNFAKSLGYTDYAQMVAFAAEQKAQAQAEQQGVSIEEYKKREAQAAELAQIKQENETLKAQIHQSVFNDDLQKIKEAFPTVKAASINDLGDDFIKLRANGVSALVAYRAVSEQKQAEIKPVPLEIGAVNETSPKEKDFYTSAEVDQLTDKELSNPKIMERVMKSMTKWRT